MAKNVYADIKGMVVFSCPNCGDLQKERAEKYKNVKSPVKIQCKCGKAYDVEIEIRNFYRKATKLIGTYSTASNPGQWIEMIVRNLSFMGCSFETLTEHQLQVDEEIQVQFILDNVKNSKIEKKAVVRYVQGRNIGCGFKEFPGAFDPGLGFYLR
jgi:predicted RNA-binding Zn-ribbon protein involved in translation (DUF1610 family)